MKNPLRFRVVILPLILLFVFLGVSIYLTLLGVGQLWTKEKQKLQASQEASLTKTLNILEDRALTIASMAAAAPGVTDAYKLAISGKEKEGRTLLRRTTEPIQRVVTTWLKVKQFKLHYHLPPAKSFLRIWRRPGHKDGGDDLSSFRKTVLEVNRTHQPVKGIEIGRGGFVVRGLVPVMTPQGKHLGSVESLVDFKKVCKLARTSRDEQVAAYMYQDGLKIARRLAAKKPPRVGKFVLYYSTKPEATDPAVNPELLEKGFHRVLSVQKGHTLVTVMPIKDYNGQPKGILVFVRDISQLLENIGTIRNGMLIGGIILLLILAAVFYLSSSSVIRILNTSVKDLVRSSQMATANAAEMFATSQKLSEGTGSQASALEETASSLEQIAAMTKANDENASQADELMQQGNQLIEDASKRMSEMSDAMNQLASSGKEISKIIKSIDEIAFQTNLLALNAAVEAARAGDAGAGFAVVADEVRNLAMRSAEAARVTQQLIEETVGGIDRGAKLVSLSQEGFAQVAGLIHQAATIISEIAAASKEQLDGLTLITQAVRDIDRVVQGNAATAHETAEAANALNDQAQGLQNLVDQLCSVVGEQTCRLEDAEGTPKKEDGQPVALLEK